MQQPPIAVTSITGSYVHLIVQVSRDLHPVVCADAFLPMTGVSRGERGERGEREEGKEEREEDGKERHPCILTELEAHDQHGENDPEDETSRPHPPRCLLVGRNRIVELVFLLSFALVNER